MDLLNQLGGYFVTLPNDVKRLLVPYMDREDKAKLAAELFITSNYYRLGGEPTIEGIFSIALCATIYGLKQVYS